jgi:hypothetical protein
MLEVVEVQVVLMVFLIEVQVVTVVVADPVDLVLHH